jgi:hypothetical protein
MEYVKFPFGYSMILSSERIHGTETRIHHSFRGKVLGKISKLHIKYVLIKKSALRITGAFILSLNVAKHRLKSTVTCIKVLQQS